MLSPSRCIFLLIEIRTFKRQFILQLEANFKSSAFFGVFPNLMAEIVQTVQPPPLKVDLIQRLVPLLPHNPHPLRLGGVALEQKPHISSISFSLKNPPYHVDKADFLFE